MKRAMLERERGDLVDWKTEWDKSEDNSEASGEGDGLKRAVRLRFFNSMDVIAEQVCIMLQLFSEHFTVAVPPVLQGRGDPGGYKEGCLCPS